MNGILCKVYFQHLPRLLSGSYPGPPVTVSIVSFKYNLRQFKYTHAALTQQHLRAVATVPPLGRQGGSSVPWVGWFKGRPQSRRSRIPLVVRIFTQTYFFDIWWGDKCEVLAAVFLHDVIAWVTNLVSYFVFYANRGLFSGFLFWERIRDIVEVMHSDGLK